MIDPIARTRRYTPVRASPEFERVRALPTREITPENFDELRRILTKPKATMRLWDDQCAALLEALSVNGLFGCLDVGAGKTLISQLLPTVLDKKAVILTTPGLVEQGRQMRTVYRRSFHIRDDLRYVSYSTLSTAESARVLEDMNPELIIPDEFHCLKDPNAARTKRFLRFMKRHPRTLLCVLSGTPAKRSIKDFWHMLILSLRDGSPLPKDRPTATEWAEALDVMPDGVMPRPAGVLRQFCANDLESPRVGWQRRFKATAGVVTSTTSDLDSELILRKLKFRPSGKILAALADLENKWELPTGEQLIFSLELARAKRQVRMGGYYRWVWPAEIPERDRQRWKFFRSEYQRNLRLFLKIHSKEDLDSIKLVENAIDRGEVQIDGFDQWQKVSAEISAPDTVWEWIDKSSVLYTVQWARANAPSIVWTDVVPVGAEIGLQLGVPYYGAGSEAAEGILAEKGNRCVVASIKAHGTGRNLQAFRRALVAGGSPTGLVWHQLLGRLHRSGQLAKTVEFDLMFPEEMFAAQKDAEFNQETLGNDQKLLTATIV